MTQQAKHQVGDRQSLPAAPSAVHGLSQPSVIAYDTFPAVRNTGITYGSSSLLNSDLDISATSTGSTAWTGQFVTLSDINESKSAELYVGSPILPQKERPSGLYRPLTGMPQHFQSSLNKRALRQLLNQRPRAVTALRMLDASILLSSIYASSGNLISDTPWGDPIETTNYDGILSLLGGELSNQRSVDQAEETAAQVILDAPIFSRNAEAHNLAEHLLQLDKDIQEEEDPTCPGISVPSLRAFLSFQSAHADLTLPIVSATPECNIYASWKAGRNRLFSIHFLGDDNVRFVIFRPNEKHADRTVRISGTATADVVFDIGAAHGVREWACK